MIREVIDKDIAKLAKQMLDIDYHKDFYQKWLVQLTKEYSKEEVIRGIKTALYYRAKSPAYVDKVLRRRMKFEEAPADDGKLLEKMAQQTRKEYEAAIKEWANE